MRRIEDDPSLNQAAAFVHSMRQRENKRVVEPVADGGGLPPLESAEDAWKRGYEEGVQEAIFNETGCRLESVDDVPPYTQPVSPEESSRPAEKKKESNDDWNDWDNGGGFDVAGK